MDNFFFEQLRSILGTRYDSFRAAFDGKPRHKALRVNTVKISVEKFLSEFGCRALAANPLCSQSFYAAVKPSLDPLYHAGLYYMQEPSASAAVSAFAPYIGKRVLDLCSAPGGKATQAAALADIDILFCNDVEPKRLHALADNVERLGITNAVITRNTAADYVRAGFCGWFDTIIIDAPCSGGGMMRYESVPYSREIVAGCAARQRAILQDAVRLLSRGGHLLYSTCTFAREENEENIEYLCALGLEPIEIPLCDGTERGLGVPQARRIYPMNFDGEGHFYCVLEKPRGELCDKPPQRKKKCSVEIGGVRLDGEEIFGRAVLPIDLPETEGLNVVRVGVPMLDGRNPSHALSHALGTGALEKIGTVELGALSESYIRGEQLDFDAAHGILVATVGGYAIGWVRSAATGDGCGALKNLYPKSLRVR